MSNPHRGGTKIILLLYSPIQVRREPIRRRSQTGAMLIFVRSIFLHDQLRNNWFVWNRLCFKSWKCHYTLPTAVRSPILLYIRKWLKQRQKNIYDFGFKSRLGKLMLINFDLRFWLISKYFLRWFLAKLDECSTIPCLQASSRYTIGTQIST